MDLLAAWLLFPLALAFVSLGCGLLTERLAGARLPGVLVMPAGLAAVLVVARLVTSWSPAAPLALPLLLVLALAGLVLSRGRLRAVQPDGWALAAAAGAFAVIGAPIFLSGEPTFGGSLVLPDTAHNLALADRLAEAGHEWRSLPDSSYRNGVSKYFLTAYPVGGQAALGVLAPLGVIDLAWLYQPFLTFVAATIALTLYSLSGGVLERRASRAAVAFVGALPALVVSFVLQGSIKEVTGLAMIVLTVGLATHALSGELRARALGPAALAAVGALACLGPPALAYAAPPLAVFAVAWLWSLRRRPRRSELAAAAGVVLAAVLLALPVLIDIRFSLRVTSGTLTAESRAEDLGNLAAPVSKTQASGVHLGGDYRYPPRSEGLERGLALVVLGAAVLGVLLAFRRRARGPLLLAASLGGVSVYLLSRGSAYADAKVLMVASPALAALGMLGALLVAERPGRLRKPGRFAGLLLAAVIAGAVLVSDALAYHEVQLAPYERYRELERIDERLAGSAIVTFTAYDEFAKYFLRDTRVLSIPEYPLPFEAQDKARHPTLKTPIDTDELPLARLQGTSFIVMPRSPFTSRPPASFERTFAGRYYEVWRRDPAVAVTDRLTLGDTVFEPAARTPCERVLALARRAERPGARLAYVPRPPPSSLSPLTKTVFQPFWVRVVYPVYPRSIVVGGPGVGTGMVSVARSGRYRVWLGGSFGRGTTIRVDGEEAGTVSYEPGNPGQYLPLATLRLSRGRHRITVERGGGDLRPGNGGGYLSNLLHIGPVVLSPPANERRAVRYLAPERASELCGRSLDWVEVVAPARGGARAARRPAAPRG